jgi:hypothetical protein
LLVVGCWLLVAGGWLLMAGESARVRCGATSVYSGREPDDFKFGGRIDSGEKLVDAKHRRVLQFRFTALAALKDGQRLQNHN